MSFLKCVMNHPVLPGNQLYPALVICIEIPLKSWYVNLFHVSLTCKQEVTLWLPQETISVTVRETDTGRMMMRNFSLSEAGNKL